MKRQKPWLSSYLFIIRLLCGSFPVLCKAHQSIEERTNVIPFPIIDSSTRVFSYLPLNHKPDQNLNIPLTEYQSCQLFCVVQNKLFIRYKDTIVQNTIIIDTSPLFWFCNTPASKQEIINKSQKLPLVLKRPYFVFWWTIFFPLNLCRLLKKTLNLVWLTIQNTRNEKKSLHKQLQKDLLVKILKMIDSKDVMLV